MITFRISTDVHDDHRIVLALPPEVPTGQTELVVSVTSQARKPERRPRTSLADWADENAEHWGNRVDASDVESFTGRRF
jgi:hypothetical protein